MSLVRPSIRDWALARREAIGWAALVGLGLWLVGRSLAPFAPLLFLLGGGMALIGAALFSAAIRRRAFGAEAPGEGLVEIDEGRITYLGPHGGGVIDIATVTRVGIATRPGLLRGASHAWVLAAADGTRLAIPVGARGAERLPDALSPLPGLDLGAAVAALGRRHPGEAVIWSRERRPGRGLIGG